MNVPQIPSMCMCMGADSKAAARGEFLVKNAFLRAFHMLY
jgi:hypothetical protein